MEFFSTQTTFEIAYRLFHFRKWIFLVLGLLLKWPIIVKFYFYDVFRLFVPRGIILNQNYLLCL